MQWRSLQFRLEYVEAGHDDHVLLAVDDLQESTFVEGADITSPKITVVRECRGVRFGLLPVTVHYLRALGADLARLADADFAALFVEQLDVSRRHRQPGRTVKLQ